MPRFYKYTLYSLYFYKENIIYISMHDPPPPPQKKRKQYIHLSVDMLMWTLIYI